MKYFAVTGCTFSTETPGTLVVVPISSASTKCIVAGKPVYMSPLSISVTFTDTMGYVGTTVASINSSSEKNIIEDKKPILEGDSVSVQMVLTLPDTVLEKTVTIDVKVDSAGQTFARGN